MLSKLWSRIEDEYGYALEDFGDEIQDELEAISPFLEQCTNIESTIEGISRIIDLFLLVVDTDNIYEESADVVDIIKDELEIGELEPELIENFLSTYDFEAGKSRGIQFRNQWV